MVRKLVTSEFGTIFDAVMSKKDPERMTDDRVDRTNECIIAVANHMKHKADCNLDNEFWKYSFEHHGALIWVNEDCYSLMGKIWSKIKEKSFEQYDADNDMAEEWVVKLEDVYEVFYDIMNQLVGLEGLEDKEQEVQ